MEIIELEATPIADTPHKVDVRKLYSFEHATIVHIKLKKGESLYPHITSVDVIFYILEGKGKVMIGDEEKEVEKDMLIFSPKKIKHKLSNPYNDDFRFLVIKVPTPTEQTKILL